MPNEALSSEAQQALISTYRCAVDLEKALATLHARGGPALTWPSPGPYMKGGCREDGVGTLIDILRQFASTYGVELPGSQAR